MAFIAPLFLALTDLIITRRSPKTIADQWRISIPDLANGYQRIEHCFWQGRLALALEKPDERPELIPLLTELARIEDHYADLMYQFRRANLVAEEAAKFKNTNLELQMKATSVTFRIHQAATRIIRDLQKARLAFEKAENPEAHPAPAPRTKSTTAVAQPSGQTDTSSDSRSNVSSPQLTTESPKEPEPQELQKSSIEPPVKKKYEPQPVDPLVQACLARNRHRIRNTPSKDRPALIEKLIAADREKHARTAA